MIATLALFAVVGAGLLVWGERLGPARYLVAAVAPLTAAVWTAWQLPSIVRGSPPVEHVAWVGALDLGLDLRLDGMAATMTLLVSIIGVLVLVYSRGYFSPTTPDQGRLAGLLVLFAGAMVGLVQADHLLLVYTCWEITSITSYLLIGNNHTDANARAAALHALLVTGAGGLAMLVGFVLIGHAAGTYRLSELAANGAPTDGARVTAGLVLILLGAFTKSAQYPFHAWLPGAMAAPTPVSTYLHSATMVKAGVYLVARLAPVFAAAAIWRPAVLIVGLVTLIGGGLRALRQHDLKLLLAFGTVSQLGLMMVVFGAGTNATAVAGWALLVAHALFKAALFMVVGAIDHHTGTRDIRQIPAFDHRWRGLEIASGISVASMAGVPLAVGFVAKEAVYTSLADATFTGNDLVLAAAVAGSMLTVAYAARFHWGAFVAPRRRDRERTVERPAATLAVPVGLLAAATVVLGVAPWLGDDLATAAATALDPAAPDAHLALWHGVNLPLLLSAVTLAGGWLISVQNRHAQRVLAAGSGIPRGDVTYLGVLQAVSTVARRSTAIVQNGSLPIYSGVILATAAVLPAGALLLSDDTVDWPGLGRAADVPLAALLLSAAISAAFLRRRFSAAVALSAVGYAMAGFFVAFGAPDLALTQVAVETVTTVVFVLVLRRLPDRFERQSSSRRRAGRVVVAAAVGCAVFWFAIAASSSGPTELSHVSEELVERSVPDGHGRNVVNVILVDFRGFDTLGEITVLAAASIGAVALARVGRRIAEAHGERQRPSPSPSSFRRIVFVDVAVRTVFHLVLMASLWLLFAGHNQPGGGFVGGLLAGAAITLRYVAGGIDEIRARSRFRPWTVLGAGLLLAAGTAIAPVLTGGDPLEVASATVTLPIFGDVFLTSALAFDVGVYLTVLGVVLMVFEAFGEDDPADAAGLAAANQGPA